MSSAPILSSLLLDGVERTQAGVAGRGEDHVGAFGDLGQRKFLALARIFPRGIVDADVILDHANVWINGVNTFFVPLGETMNESDVHPAEKADRAGTRCFGSDYADEIRAFMFAKLKRS